MLGKLGIWKGWGLKEGQKVLRDYKCKFRYSYLFWVRIVNE